MQEYQDSDFVIVQFGAMVFPCRGDHARKIKATVLDIVPIPRKLPRKRRWRQPK